MKLLPLAAAVLLSGCAALSPNKGIGTAQQQQANLFAALQQLTQQDLATTLQIAQAASPPDVEAIQCVQYLQTNLSALLGAPNGIIAPTGVASSLETIRLVNIHLVSGGSSVQNVPLEMACGPLAISTELILAQDAVAAASIPTGNGFVHFLLSLVPLLPAAAGL